MKADTQLALSVHLPDDETFKSYQGSNNELVINQIKSFVEQKLDDKKASPDINGCYLFGLNGVGKSHLLHAACTFATDKGLTSVCLSLTDKDQYALEMLEGFEQFNLVCLDDVQALKDSKEWQQAIFDLFNRVSEQNNLILISGDKSVAQLELSLPDLVSRLSWGYVEQVKPLTDAEKLIAIQFRAQQRGMVLSDEVANYLLTHHSRDMNKLIESLDRLDKASIREQRKITIPFIKSTLF